MSMANAAVARTRGVNDNLAAREMEVVITPSNYERRIDKLDRPYAWVRGKLTYRHVEKTRTVMVQGEAYHLIQHLLGVGTSLKIRALRDVVPNANGGAEIFRARDVLKVFDAEGRELDGATGLPLREVAGHDRKGYYRRQHYGPGNSMVRIVWIDDCKVKGGAKAA